VGGGSKKLESSISGSIFTGHVGIRGILNNGSGSARGIVPGNGSVPWQRTSDVHTGAGSETWATVLNGAVCSSGSGTWDLGDLTGGFEIKYVDSGGNCN